MKTMKILCRLIMLAALLLMAGSLLAACMTARMTVKFTENGCTYDGPASIPFGKFKVYWTVNDQKHNKTGLVIITLAEGKTIDDLKATHSAEAPQWVNILWIDEENAFGSELEKVRSYSHEHDLQIQVNYHGEPLYMVCGNEQGMTGSLGPIEVTK
jgi:hypothetical protein